MEKDLQTDFRECGECNECCKWLNIDDVHGHEKIAYYIRKDLKFAKNISVHGVKEFFHNG